MAKSDGYSFVNSYLIPLPLTGLDTPVGIEYDHRTNKIYWTDEVKHTVNRAALNGSFQEVIVQVADNFGREISIISFTDCPPKYYRTFTFFSINNFQNCKLIWTCYRSLEIYLIISISAKTHPIWFSSNEGIRILVRHVIIPFHPRFDRKVTRPTIHNEPRIPYSCWTVYVDLYTQLGRKALMT